MARIAENILTSMHVYCQHQACFVQSTCKTHPSLLTQSFLLYQIAENTCLNLALISCPWFAHFFHNSQIEMWQYTCIIVREDGREKNPVWPERWKMPQLGDYWSKITDYCSPTPNFNPWWSACLKKMTFSFVAMKTQHTYVWPWPWKMGQLVKHKRLLLRGWDQT